MSHRKCVTHSIREHYLPRVLRSYELVFRDVKHLLPEFETRTSNVLENLNPVMLRKVKMVILKCHTQSYFQPCYKQILVNARLDDFKSVINSDWKNRSNMMPEIEKKISVSKQGDIDFNSIMHDCIRAAPGITEPTTLFRFTSVDPHKFIFNKLTMKQLCEAKPGVIDEDEENMMLWPTVLCTSKYELNRWDPESARKLIFKKYPDKTMDDNVTEIQEALKGDSTRNIYKMVFECDEYSSQYTANLGLLSKSDFFEHEVIFAPFTVFRLVERYSVIGRRYNYVYRFKAMRNIYELNGICDTCVYNSLSEYDPRTLDDITKLIQFRSLIVGTLYRAEENMDQLNPFELELYNSMRYKTYSSYESAM